MRKIIIDCDPGHDDIMAIITALTMDVEILGFTTVAGNNTLEKITDNLLKVLDHLNIKLPVYKGYDRPMVYDPEPQPAGHGESGLDGPVLKEAVSKVEDKCAEEFLLETLIKNDSTTLVCLGPLTNIGYLLKNHPEVKEKIEGIYLMGGAIDGGNINKCAEFNIYHDPHAAKIVFESGVKIVMAPLEACKAGSIYLKETDALDGGRIVAQLVFDLMKFYGLYAINRGWDSTSIFDVLPVVYLAKPEYFTGFKADVEVVLEGEDTRGQTICHKNENGNVTVLYDADRDAFINYFMNAINVLDDKLSLS